MQNSVLHEGQAGFRAKRSCVDNIYVLSEIVQGRLREGKKTYAFFLDVQKAYDTVWRNGLWVKMWELGVRGKMWRVIKEMYSVSRSVDGECSEAFDVQQGDVAYHRYCFRCLSMALNRPGSGRN